MSEPYFVGTLMPFPYSFVPRGWIACNGQELQIRSYQVLFSLLTTTYGGDGRTTFRLPQLNPSSNDPSLVAVMGQGSGPGLTARAMADRVGQSTSVLATAEMPSHAHRFQLSSGAGNPTNLPSAGAALLDPQLSIFVPPDSQPAATLSPTAMTSTGQGTPHDNMQPYMQMCWCICYDGFFPNRI